jgi:hypothetical protein
MSAYQNIINQANQVAATPYQAYSGELTAPINTTQSGGISNISNAAGMINPYINAATGLAGSSAATISPTQFSGQQVAQYMSPYLNSVANSTIANINETNAQQQNQVIGNAIAKGAWGGDRAGVAQAELARQQNLSNNATLSNLWNTGYNNALSEFNTQQALDYQAQQQNAANRLAAGNAIAGYGSTAQNAAIAQGQAQLAAGTQAQTTQQAADTAAYEQFQKQQAYPFQTAQWLAGLTLPAASGMGGTTNSFGIGNQSQSTPGPNIGSQILGSALTLGSMFLKDGGAVRQGLASGGTPYSDDISLSYVPEAAQIQMQHPQQPVAPQMQMASLGNAPAADSGLKRPSLSGKQKENIKGGLGGLWSAINGAGEPIQLSGANLANGVGSIADVPSIGFGDFGGLYAGGGAVDDDSDLSDAERVFARMINRESGGKQFGSDGLPLTSPKGAIGRAQVMPGTAPEAAALVGLPFDDNRYRNDPEYNTALGKAYYQKQLKDFGSPELAAAAYNAGPGALQKALARADAEGGDWRNYVPSETRAYVPNVMGRGAPPAATGALNPALAYDGPAKPQPSSGGLGAIADLIGGDAPVSSNTGAAKEDKILGLIPATPELRQALLAAGLGMMASRSPNLGQAVGEGGLAGLGAYQNLQNAKRQQTLADAQIANYRSEAEARKAQIDLKVREFERQVAAAKAAAGLLAQDPSAAPSVPAATSQGATSAPGSPTIPAPGNLPSDPRQTSAPPTSPSQTPISAAPDQSRSPLIAYRTKLTAAFPGQDESGRAAIRARIEDIDRRLQEMDREQYHTVSPAEYGTIPGLDPNYQGVVQRNAKTGAISFPGKAATTVNIDQKGEAAYSQEAGKGMAKKFQDISTEGDTARNDLALIGQLRDLGNVIGTGAPAAIQAWLANQGIKVGDNVGAIEAYSSIVDKLTPSQRVPGTGATSDYEARLFKASLPRLINTPEGNAIIEQTLSGLAQSKLERAGIAEKALAGEMSPKEALNALRDLPSPYEAVKAAMGEKPPTPASGRTQAEPTKQQQQRPLQAAPPDVIEDARGAISRGAPRDAVIQRLKERGLDPSGL